MDSRTRNTPGGSQTPGYARRLLDRLASAPEDNVIWYEGRWLSASELRTAICGAASGLTGLGITRGGTVAALTRPNHPLMIVIRHAANLLGARIVYIRSVNPRSEDVGMTQSERAQILRDTRTDVLFADRASLPEALGVSRMCDRPVPVCAFGACGSGSSEVAELDRSDELPPEAAGEMDPDSTAAVIYTSGTAGVPKGVCMSCGAWDSMVRGFARSQSRPLTFLAVTPISQAVSTMLDGCLAAGGSVVLHPSFDSDAVLDTIVDLGVTGAYMAMPHLYGLLDNPRIRSSDISRMRCLIYSGTPASRKHMEDASERFGMSLIQSYGTTEAGPISVLLPMAHRSPDLRRTVGRPLPGVRVRICDPLTGSDLGVGATGEVLVRSSTTMSGYLGGPDGGTVVFEDGWLRTGDLGTIDSRGYISLLGRVGDVIKCRGIKVFPAVVEDALASHEDVSAAHVYGHRSADDVEEVHAAVVLNRGSTASYAELCDWVASQLSALHVPDVITVWDALPLTANGKVDRRLVAKAAQSDSDGIGLNHPTRLERPSGILQGEP